MLNLLLKKNEVESIMILGTVNYGFDTSIPFIEKNILNYKSTIKHNLIFLNKIFKELGYTDVKMRILNNNVIIEGASDEIHNNLLFKTSAYLMSQSASAIFFTTFFSTKYPSKQYIIQNSFISESYLSKLLFEINTHIEPMGLQFISRKQQLKIVGEPLTALYFIFSMRQFLSFMSDDYSQTLPDTLFTTTSSNIDHTHITSLYGAFDHFENPNDHPLINNSDALELLNMLIDVNNVATQLPAYESDFNQQDLIANLFLRLAASEVDNVGHRQEFSQRLVTLAAKGSQNKLLKDSLKISHLFYQTFQNEFNNREEVIHDILYILIVKQIEQVCLASHIDSFFEKTPDFIVDLAAESQGLKRIKTFIDSLDSINFEASSTQKLLTDDREMIEEELYGLIPYAPEPLLIYVELGYQLARAHYLKETILLQFSNKSVQFTTQKQEADLIISDRLKEAPDNVAFFYIVNTNLKQTLDVLMSFIAKESLKKNTNHL